MVACNFWLQSIIVLIIYLNASSILTTDPNAEWHGNCFAGERQSPVNISSKEIYKVFLQPITFSGECEDDMEITVRVLYEEVRFQPLVDILLTGGLLPTEYHLSYFKVIHHSEHQIDGKFFPLELQFILIGKMKRYEKVKDNPNVGKIALNNNVSILSVLYEVQPRESYKNTPEIDRVKAALEQFSHTNMTEEGINTTLTLSALIPDSTGIFYFYIGSLTTQNCTENIKWFVLNQTMPLSENSANNLFEVLNSSRYEKYCKPRELQELFGRQVYQYNFTRSASAPTNFDPFFVTLDLIIATIIF